MKSPTVALLTALVTLAQADVPSDLVTSIPGFQATDFNTYSGYLHVPGPIAGYDSLKIAYIFNEARSDPSSKPLTTWHQGSNGVDGLIYVNPQAFVWVC